MWIRWHHPTSALILTVVPRAAAVGVTGTGSGEAEGCTRKLVNPTMDLSHTTPNCPRPAASFFAMTYRPVYQRPR